ncbi:MAG: TonB-dependent receptor [Bacteroidales bacterium]|nr:TonB-dependent receptor [Bacteroidales bacterium]
MRIGLLVVLMLLSVTSFAQKGTKGLLYGKVTDEQSMPIDLANVGVAGLSLGVTTDSKGRYELELPVDTTLTVNFTFVGYKSEQRTVRLAKGEKHKLDVTLTSTAISLPDAVISDRAADASSLTRLNAKQATLLPSIGGGVENLVKTLPGVISNNELSSQYTVRGGNFDENLIYVNGIEIYRPFLVGSGQQEGLSFVNSRLVNNIEFSAGGFAAEYGDKMSSVLDVTYKKPRETGGSLALSLLGAEAHVEGVAGKDKFSYLIGARYKNTAIALNLMDTKGSYKPNFTDVQALFNYKINDHWDVSLLGYYAKNQYYLVPESSSADAGYVNSVVRLDIYFEGMEVDDYTTGLGALTFDYKPHKDLDLKFIASAYSAYETETYDILGEYYLGQVETSLGSEQQGNVVSNMGTGAFLKHARNAFYVQVYNLDHKGVRVFGDNVLKWGLRYQRQNVDDVVNEWNMVDSAGYCLPHPMDEVGVMPSTLPDLTLDMFHRGHNILGLNNADGFVQHSMTFPVHDEGSMVLTVGVRANYWDYNHKFYVSPRAGIAYKPNIDDRDLVLRLSGGVYQQTPFYREFRNRDGSLFEEAQPQRSYQAILGSDYKFRAWGRPFILTSEAYYKYLDYVIPYDVDNVRIRYYADQRAKGYAMGLDFKVNGEFVKGIDSWASLSFMRNREDVEGDYYLVDADGKMLNFYNHSDAAVADTVFMGWHYRPSNQRVSFSLFFQDYIPNAPTWKVNMTLTFGTGMPVNSNDSEFYRVLKTYPPYRRVDIGFVKQLINEGSSFRKGNPLNYVKNMFVSLEVFNLLNIPNTVSYTWVKDVYNNSHGINSYLTPRYVNLKLVTEF